MIEKDDFMVSQEKQIRMKNKQSIQADELKQKQHALLLQLAS